MICCWVQAPWSKPIDLGNLGRVPQGSASDPVYVLDAQQSGAEIHQFSLSQFSLLRYFSKLKFQITDQEKLDESYPRISAATGVQLLKKNHVTCLRCT